MNIQDLYIYPVKSLGGIRIEQGKALQKGFEFDRRWMLADETGRVITQREEHSLALLSTEITAGGIKITNKLSKENFEITTTLTSKETVQVTVWEDTIQSLYLNKEIDNWFSSYLKKSVKFVYQPEHFQRALDSKYAFNGEQVSFADAFPYLLISQASLNELNSRLKQPVPMNRFRPNLIVSGTVPFEEDTWSEIQIGEVRFNVAKPCSRCVLTTVNQDTGIAGKEPLKTLAKYRTVDNKVMFGQNLIALNEGIIRTGDTVKILSTKP